MLCAVSPWLIEDLELFESNMYHLNREVINVFIFIGSVLSFFMKSDALNMVLDMLNHFAKWVLSSRCLSMLASWAAYACS